VFHVKSIYCESQILTYCYIEPADLDQKKHEYARSFYTLPFRPYRHDPCANDPLLVFSSVTELGFTLKIERWKLK